MSKETELEREFIEIILEIVVKGGSKISGKGIYNRRWTYIYKQRKTTQRETKKKERERQAE